jgi:hypothetical protein
MSYTVACECSKILPVSAGDAGSTIACSCGREVSVPSLGILRQQAGQLGGSPEMILDSMLQNGELPEDGFCVGCHTNTEQLRYFEVVCEQAETKGATLGLTNAIVFIFFGWLISVLSYVSMLRRETEPARGRNVHYRLPLRICPMCDAKRSAAEIKELLCRVPVYEHLLNKYPHAQVSAV